MASDDGSSTSEGEEEELEVEFSQLCARRDGKLFYKKFEMDGVVFRRGDFVNVLTEDETTDLRQGTVEKVYQAQIIHIYHDDPAAKVGGQGGDMGYGVEIAWLYDRDYIKKEINAAAKKELPPPPRMTSRANGGAAADEGGGADGGVGREWMRTHDVDDDESAACRERFYSDDRLHIEPCMIKEEKVEMLSLAQFQERRAALGAYSAQAKRSVQYEQERARYDNTFFFAEKIYKSQSRKLGIKVDPGLSKADRRRTLLHHTEADNEEGEHEEGGEDDGGSDDDEGRTGKLGGKSSRRRPHDDDDEDPLKDPLAPFSRAAACLQLSAVPRSLPCREVERKVVYDFIRSGISSGGGGLNEDGPALYLSGMPGTGKTATVREVVKALEVESSSGKIPPFRVVELNGMRLPNPTDAYSEFWHQLSGERLTSKRAAQKLEARFRERQPGPFKIHSPKKQGRGRDKDGKDGRAGGKRKTPDTPGRQSPRKRARTESPVIVLIADELDYMVTKTQTVLYNLFDWPTRAQARLLVVGIANTMDLPERMNSKLRSRMGSGRQIFRSYKREQVEQIVRARLSEVDVFEPHAIGMAARKVAAYSGDVRRALQLCSRAAEIRRNKLALELSRLATGASASGSGPGSRSGFSTGLGSGSGPGGRWRGAGAESASGSGSSARRMEDQKVTIEDVNAADKELNESTHLEAIKHASKVEVLLLVAVAAIIRVSGKETTKFEAVMERMTKIDRAMRKTEHNRYKAPSHAEALEICTRLTDVQVLRMGWDYGERLPSLQLTVHDSALAEYLKEHPIAQRFLPEDI